MDREREVEMADLVVTKDGEIVDRDELSRELRARRAEDELYGTNSGTRVYNAEEPGTNSPSKARDRVMSPKVEVEVEVGERSNPYERRAYNPNSIIAPVDRDWEEKVAPGYTILRPGTKRD